MTDKIQIDGAGVQLIYDGPVQVRVDGTGLSLVYDKVGFLQVDGLGLQLVYSDIIFPCQGNVPCKLGPTSACHYEAPAEFTGPSNIPWRLAPTSESRLEALAEFSPASDLPFRLAPTALARLQAPEFTFLGSLPWRLAPGGLSYYDGPLVADWPRSLPSAPNNGGYKETPPDTLLREKNEVGPDTVRRHLLAAVRKLSLPYRLLPAQLDAFDDFLTRALQSGAVPFLLAWPPPPRPTRLVLVRVAAPPAYVHQGAGVHDVSLELEILPRDAAPPLSAGVRTWPAALPLWPNTGNDQETPPDNLLRDQPGAGPGQVRRRSVAAVRKLTLPYRLTPAQVEIFDAWLLYDLQGGALSFTRPWPAPPRESQSVAMRLTALPTYEHQGAGVCDLNLEMEILP